MFNQLTALPWWYQNCYWCQHPGQCCFWTASPRSRWRQNWMFLHLDLFCSLREGILLPSLGREGNSAGDHACCCVQPCLTSESATARTRALPSFFFTEGKNISVTELPACALSKGESRWKVFITLGIWDSLQLFCEELLSFSVSRFSYSFWEEVADKMTVWHLILREF